jgi:hypothetical protein
MYVVNYKYIHTCIKYIVIHTVHTYQHTNPHSCRHIYTSIRNVYTNTYMHTYKHCTYPLGGRKERSDWKVWQGSVNASILNSLAAHRLLAQTRYHLRYVQRRTLRPALSHAHYIHTHTHTHILKILKYLQTYCFQVMNTFFSTYKHYTKSVENSY